MNEMYKRIEDLCVEKGVSVTKMCREAGVSRAPLTELKMERTQKLSAENLDKIANYFGVSISYLLGTEKEKAPSDDEAIRELAEAMLERPDVRSLMEVAMANNPSEVENMTEFMRKLRGGK